MGLKILVAEDDRHTRRILDHIFTKDPVFRDQEVQMLLAPDGEEALRLFENESPDLVISDLLMPRLDGFALCRAIRKLPQGKNVPIIVTSAIYKETALLNRMREELGVEFFAKPFQVRELVAGVQRLLEQRMGGTVAGKKSAGLPAKAADDERFRKGELADRNLAAIIFDIIEARVTGVLTLRRGRVKKEVYCILGNPVGAESNIRTESLGSYLVLKRVLDERQHQTAITHAKNKGISLMEAVVDKEWLGESDILRHHTALVKLKIINSLRWHEGHFAFVEGDSFSQRIPKATIDTASIVLLGLQRVMNVDEVAETLEKESTRSIRLTVRAERYRDVFSKVFGEDVLRMLPAQPSIDDLRRKGIDSLTVYKHVQALLLTGFAELGEAKGGAQGAAVPAEDPIGLSRLKQEATLAGEARVASRSSVDGVLYEEIFGVDEISVVTAIADIEPVANRHASDEISIDIQLDTEVDAPAMSASEARKLIVGKYLGIHEKNYYEILEVDRDAGAVAIQRGYDALNQKFGPESFKRVDLGLDHPKLEEVHQLIQQAYETLTDTTKRQAYDKSLKQRDAVSRADPLEAEEAFQEGKQLLGAGEAKRAAEQFETAIRIVPESPDYAAWLAWARFSADPGSAAVATKALDTLEKALAKNPDAFATYLFQGRIQVKQGDRAAAVKSLGKALNLDPAGVEAFDELAQLHTENGDWKLLERQHRKVLHRLGTRNPERSITLWKSLARVYKDHLKDPDSARVALDVVQKIAPNDPEIAAALAELQEPDPMRYAESSEALKSKWLSGPAEPGALRDLFKLYQAMDQPDAAFITASLLVHFEAASAEQAELHARFRPRFLHRARREIDAEIWQKIRHQNDDPQTASLFETLALLPADFDFESGNKLAPGTPVDELAGPCARVLDYLAGLLQVPWPAVYVREEGPRSATLTGPINPGLSIHTDLMRSEDTLELAAHLARVLPYFWIGRAFGRVMDTKQLRNILMGAMKFVAPRLKVDDASGAIGRISKRLSGAAPEVRKQLTDVMHALTKERSSLNITRWMRGMSHSANRFALIAVGDLPTLAPHLPAGESDAALEDLRGYALSSDHFEIRRSMALSIAV